MFRNRIFKVLSNLIQQMVLFMFKQDSKRKANLFRVWIVTSIIMTLFTVTVQPTQVEAQADITDLKKALMTTSANPFEFEHKDGAYQTTFDPLAYVEQKTVASDNAAGDYFGGSVSISGDTALIGSEFSDVGTNADQGAVYVFVYNGTDWIEQAKLTASDGSYGDNFGAYVYISGDIALIGAEFSDVGANVNQGAAYVFVRSGATWIQQAKLTASDGMANDQFGNSVSISGNTALIGAKIGDVSANVDQGSAYVFVHSGVTWIEQAKLTASDGMAGDNFGWSVSISDNTALIGAWHDDVDANTDQGSAYIFTRSGATWSQQAQLTATDGAVSDIFGFSVSISGDTALVGSYRDDVGVNVDQGSVFVFVRSGPTWSQQAQLIASNGATGNRFGVSVALSGNTILAGSHFDDVGSNTDQGSAYVFVWNGTNWSQQTHLIASDGGAVDLFGGSVALSGDTALVSSYLDDVGTSVDQGSAYFYPAYRNDADLALDTSASMITAQIGDTIDFTVTVNNPGSSTVTNVNAFAPLPSDLTYISATATQGNYDPFNGLWSLGNLSSGETASLTLQATVASGFGSPLTFAPHLTVQDTNNANNAANVSITVSIIISGSVGTAGATLSYIDGSLKTITSDEAGHYIFLVPYYWAGTVTPSKRGYTFSPVSMSYTNVTADQTAQNYTATTTCTSTGAQDGWVLESKETSEMGGSLNATDTILHLGDDKNQKQYRSILSFATGAKLPDNASITSVTLMVKKQSATGGGGPVTTFQGFMVDIKKGFFGTTALQTADFQTAPTKSLGPFTPAIASGWYSMDLTGGKSLINKLGTNNGLTQIRLRFKLGDNNNSIANYLSLYSGNAPAASRPQLVIQYYAP